MLPQCPNKDVLTILLLFVSNRGMNDKRCHVELSKAPTPEQVQQVEDRLNLYIRRNYPVHVTFTETRPPTMPKGKSLHIFTRPLDTKRQSCWSACN